MAVQRIMAHQHLEEWDMDFARQHQVIRCQALEQIGRLTQSRNCVGVQTMQNDVMAAGNKLITFGQ